MKKTRFLLPFVFPALLAAPMSLANEVMTLSQRVAPDFAQQASRNADNKGQTLSGLATQYRDALLADGSWPDIDYTIVATDEKPIRAHLDRIRVLAAAEHLFPQAGYAQAAIEAMYYWYSADRTNKNWWWNEIGKQLRLGPAALMLGSALPSDLKTLIQGDMPSAPYKTGANRTDLSKAVIFGGLLANDAAQVQRGLEGIAETIMITEAEGVQADYSFQQHGAQLYTGGYGEVFFDTASFWAYHVRDLQWKFSPEQIDLLSDYFLEGVRWMNSHGTLDYNARGRGISRVQVVDKSTLQQQSQYIVALSPQRAQEAEQFRRHVAGEGAGFEGFKQFWRSDYASKVGENHFIGVKMNSLRIEPTEAGNNENLLGNWLGFGSMFIMQRGDEYHNLFPVWNWALVPGVTAPQFAEKPADWGSIVMNTSFVGGVSDGRYGVAVMDMNAYGTQAKKAWFSFKDEMVALGAGIASTRSEYVNTSVNQTRLNGPVTVDGAVYEKGSRALVNASWVHHDGIGYVFPAYWYGHMNNQTQSGNWYDINRGQANEVVSDEVFMLRIGHSWQPTNASYQYIIVPNRTASQVEAYAQQSPIAVLSNSNTLQAVHHQGLNVTGVIFHQPGSINLHDGSTLSVSQASVVLIDQSAADPVVTLSTPGQGTQVQVSFDKGGVSKHTAVQTSSEPRWMGKGVLVDFSAPVLPTPPQTVMVSQDAFVRDGQYASQSFGSNSYLVVKKDGTGYNRKTVLQFDLSGQGIDSTTNATLRLHVRNVNSDVERTVTVSRLASSDWLESNISWASLPANVATGPSVGITPSDIDRWVELDVSALVQSGVVSLVLENLGSASGKSDVSFSSRESAQAPQLVLSRSQ
ncbi:TPA: DNRLRE domain-containing protein [Vibrio vulnificus]|nr:DNRLRE domain-containing protein [Vibrio vulnificus]HAS8416612.1 DNRLRE domain-containing protein [Vibrio vulnificus]